MHPQVGDTIGGKTVTGLFGGSSGSTALNNIGQIAFLVSFSDGSTGIVLATPITTNSPPVVAAGASNVVVGEGTLATNSGTYSDSDSGDTVTISASVGTGTKTGTNSGTWSWSLGTTDGPAESQMVIITADDGNGGTASTTFNLAVNNVAPTVTISAPGSVNEGGIITVSGSLSDPGIADSHTVVINWGDGSAPTGLLLAPGVFTFAATHQYLDDDPTGTASDISPITVTVTDKDNGVGSAGLGLTVNNVVPVISGVTGPTDPLAVGTAVTVSTTFTDVGTPDTHTCTFSWGDGSPDTTGTVAETGGFGSCTATRTYTGTGGYTVGVTVTDDDTGKATSSFGLVVVYDPSGGFVTGGGAINSPAGANFADPTASGTATFGFVSKYLPGRSTPDGNLQFQFKAGNLNFKSTSMDWLVVTGQPRGIFRGTGTVNGGTACKFEVDGWDGSFQPGNVDAFGLRIFSCASGGDRYSLPATPLAQGSIIVHQPRR